MRLHAGWALMGKTPGSNEDYAILAASDGPFHPAQFQEILQRFGPGTPPPPKESTPDSLPWVTVGYAGLGEDTQLWIAVRDWSSDVDGAGRPIALTWYFCVPFSDVASSPISYAGLHDAVSSIPLPRPGCEPVSIRGDRGREAPLDLTIEVDPLDPARLAADVDRFGWRAVTAAAMLLDSPVTMVQPGSLPWGDRLAFLDAVAALLPYGYRARLVAGTWAESGIKPRIRLAFSKRPRSGDRHIGWRGADDVTPGAGGVGRYYASLLETLRQRHDLSAIVHHQALDGTPTGFDDPDHAVNHLQDLDWPFLVLDAFRAGRGSAADLRELFVGNRAGMFERPDQQELLGYLVRSAEAAEVDLIIRWWDAVGADEVPGLFEDLIETVREQMWGGESTGAEARFLTWADQRGALDAAILRLLAKPKDVANERAGRGTAARLLERYALSQQPSAGVIVDLLRNYPSLACELLVQLADRNVDDLRHWLDWLKGADVPPSLTEPFGAIVSVPPRPVTWPEVASLAGHGDGCALALLRSAAALARLELVVPAVVAWAAEVVPQADPSQWSGTLAVLPVKDPAGQAVVDLLLVLFGTSPAHLLALEGPTGQGQAACDEYVRRFAEEWRSQTLDRHRQRLVVVLTRYLDGQRWAQHDAAADLVLSLLEAVSGRQEEFTRVVAHGLAQRSGLAHRPTFRPWWEKMREHVQLSTEILRGVLPDADVGWVADLSAQALLNGAGPGKVIAALRTSAYRPEAPTALKLLESVRARLTESTGSRHEANMVVARLANQIAQGELGDQLGPELCELLRQTVPYVLEFQALLLDVAVQSPGGNEQPMDRKRLAVVAQFLEEVAKEPGIARQIAKNLVRIARRESSDGDGPESPQQAVPP